MNSEGSLAFSLLFFSSPSLSFPSPTYTSSPFPQSYKGAPSCLLPLVQSPFPPLPFPPRGNHIFERFSQSGSASSQGFGIGLALARWVIESHDGTITLESPVPRDTALGDAPGTKIAVRLSLSSG